MSKTLSEVLNKTFGMKIVEHEYGTNNAREYYAQNAEIKQAEADIKAWVAKEVIGQDDSEFDAGAIIIHDKNMNPQEVFSPHKTRNQLRNEQRKRLEDLESIQ